MADPLAQLLHERRLVAQHVLGLLRTRQLAGQILPAGNLGSQCWSKREEDDPQGEVIGRGA